MKKRGELPKPGYFKNQNSYFVKTVCSWYCSQVRRTRLKQLSSSSSNNSIEDKVISLVFPSVYTKLCVCVCQLLSRVQPCEPMDYSLPGSSVSRVLQARILEWEAIPFSSLYRVHSSNLFSQCKSFTNRMVALIANTFIDSFINLLLIPYLSPFKQQCYFSKFLIIFIV